MSGLHIILFEKDETYRVKLSRFLQIHGYDVTVADSLGDIGPRSSKLDYVIYLVNFGFNTTSGLEFIANDDGRRPGPVLVLSDADDHIDRIVYLELGADDYIVKTTKHREILARIRVAQRRGSSVPLLFAPAKAEQPPREPPLLPWHFSREMRDLVAPDGNRVDLTADQFALLDTLIQNTGQALGRDYLSRAVFDRPLKAGDRSIDNLVVRLRRRLGESARSPVIIKTARAGGYFFDGFPDPTDMTHTLFTNEQRHAA